MDSDQASVTEKLGALRAAYAAKLAGRLDEIVTVAEAVTPEKASPEIRRNVETVRNLAHKLAGSAPTMGFPKLGAAAARLERACETGLKEDDTNLFSARNEEIWRLVAECRESIDS